MRKSSTPEYNCWRAMIYRCTNEKSNEFFRYGGSGITVCNEWLSSFDAFVAHIGPRPSKEHSVDRIDNALGYEPGNVRWSTPSEQQKNRSTTVWVEIDGITKCISEWSDAFNIPVGTISQRISRGWDHKAAVSTRPLPVKRVDASTKDRIKSLNVSGVSQRKLASMFCLSKRTVEKILAVTGEQR